MCTDHSDGLGCVSDHVYNCSLFFNFSVFHLWRYFRKCLLLRTQAHTRSSYDAHMIHTTHPHMQRHMQRHMHAASRDRLHTRGTRTCRRTLQHTTHHEHWRWCKSTDAVQDVHAQTSKRAKTWGCTNELANMTIRFFMPNCKGLWWSMCSL